jgi:outer membrane lipoprotein carrier protein
MRNFETLAAMARCALRYAAAVSISALVIGMAPNSFAGVEAEGSSASIASLDKILNDTQAHYRETRSFTADFVEKIESPGGAEQNRSGKVYYRKPGQMRWEFAAPDSEIIISDGKTVYSYEPDLNQVIETPVAGMVKSPSAAAFLLGIGDLRRDFKTSLVDQPPKDGLTYLVLTPKGGGGRMVAGLDPKMWNLSRLLLTDAAGDLTSLEFSNFQTNMALADSLFKFEVPAGTDIVKAPGT